MTTAPLPLTVAIPTYRRERVLLETLEHLLRCEPPAAEILVLDQTPQHEGAVESELRRLADAGQIEWLRLAEPSIPRAMNVGLAKARQPVVLFVDDDIRPEPGLLAAHHELHRAHERIIVAGRVIQPWNEGKDYSADTRFHFASLRSCWTREFIGANFSVGRSEAIEVGGFDENFVRVAYRYEAEFALRFNRAGGRIRFSPEACLHHLKATDGGTRSFGEHLTTWKPDHAVGAYYYALLARQPAEFLRRPLRAVATRHHAARPWHIPVTLLAEFRGMAWAVRLALRGPAHLKRKETT
jgi:GT2 family glycosyltransferase